MRSLLPRSDQRMNAFTIDTIICIIHQENVLTSTYTFHMLAFPLPAFYNLTIVQHLCIRKSVPHTPILHYSSTSSCDTILVTGFL